MHMEQIMDTSINMSSIYPNESEKNNIETVNGYLIWFIIDVCLFVVIVFGNVLTILAIVWTRQLRNFVSNYFVFSLAVTDLFVGMLIPYHMMFTLNHELNRVKLLCLSRYTLLGIACGVSAYTVIAIAIDRYCAIVYPLRYKLYATKRHVLIMIIVPWIIVISIVSIQIFWNKFDPSLPPSISCEIEMIYSRYYIVAIPLPVLCLNWTVLFVLYWKIRRAAHMCARRMNLSTVSSAADKNDRRNTQVVLAVVACFSICLFPYFIAACIRTLSWTSKSVVIYYRCALALTISNSAMNPLIYAWKSEHFRRAFQNILCCKSPNNKIHSSVKKYFVERQELQIKRKEMKENNRCVSESGSLRENMSDRQANHAEEKKVENTDL